MELNSELKETLSRDIQAFCQSDLDWDIGRFEAEDLLSFFAEKLGNKFYNEGLQIALQILQTKVEDISGDILAQER